MKYGNTFGRCSLDEARQLAQNKTIVYGCAYQINNENLNVALMQEPVKGIIMRDQSRNEWEPKGYYFTKLNQRGEPCKSGHVDYQSRMLADTLEESIEMFNQAVQDRKDRLILLIKDCENAFLGKDNDQTLEIKYDTALIDILANITQSYAEHPNIFTMQEEKRAKIDAFQRTYKLTKEELDGVLTNKFTPSELAVLLSK